MIVRQAGPRDNAFVWLDLDEPTADELESVRRELELHDFPLEEALSGHPRPKLELSDGELTLVLRTACHTGEEELECGELMVVAGERFIVTVRHGQATPLDGVRAQVEAQTDLSRSGPGPALQAVVTRALGDCELAVRGLERDVDRLEELVFSTTRMYRADRIYNLMRAALDLHRALAPLLPELDRLAGDQVGPIAEATRPGFRGAHRQAERLLGRADHLRELLDAALQVHLARSSSRLAQISVHHAELATRQNEEMRKIAAWVAIVAVPTMIAAIYGMNFEHMPELDWTFGYPFALGLMAVVCVALYRWFRHIDWL